MYNFLTHHSARGLEEVLILEEPRLSLPLQSGGLRLLLPLPGGGVPVVLVTHRVTGGVSGGGAGRVTPGGGQPAPSGVAGVAWCPAHAECCHLAPAYIRDHKSSGSLLSNQRSLEVLSLR